MHNPLAVPSVTEQFLTDLLHRPIEAYLLNGVRMTGTLLTFDRSGIVLGRRHSPQLILWKAISTIAALSEASRQQLMRNGHLPAEE